MSVQDHAVFDFSSKVVDYRIIKTSTGDAGSLVVLCEEELVVIDLVTPKWPSYRKRSSFMSFSLDGGKSKECCFTYLDNAIF